MENPKLEIARSFSRTIQVKQYEPAQFFCSVKQSFDKELTKEEFEEQSKLLDEMCQQEVAKSIKALIEKVKEEESPF